ncbi:hypothetical protein NKJ93_26820, partial [Mesorhizobium sp. M0028]|uniref:hypothetical protein n=1 Tax=Mesorhizobium sp. M0028 TaxID=2956849 RepID=UPI0033366BAC
DLAFQVDLLASVHLDVVDDGMWEVVTWDRDAYAVLCYPPSNRGSNRHLVTNAYSPSHAMDSGAGSVFFKRLLVYAGHPKADLRPELQKLNFIGEHSFCLPVRFARRIPRIQTGEGR